MSVQFRTILNRVLVNVGETEILASQSDLGTNKYHRLVANFLNTIKNEVESATNWRVLRTDVPFTVAALSSTATNAAVDDRARVLRIPDQERGQFVPLVFDITDAANPLALIEVDMVDLQYMIRINPAPSSDQEFPAYFAMDSFTNGTTAPQARIVVFPRPTTQRTISAFMVVPQARLADADLNIWIKVPDDLLELGTTWYALMERGEEMGTDGLFTEERYRQALNAAVARDDAEQGGIELVAV